MNFIECSVAQRNGATIVDAGSFAMEVPSDLVVHMKDWMSKKVIFGIRPEDIQDRAFMRDAPAVWALKAMVEVNEPLGSDVILHLSSGPHLIVARVDPHSQARMGQGAEVIFNMRKMHLFDPQTHQAII
jgi:multiple sugar transport system ATP-binding protein